MPLRPATARIVAALTVLGAVLRLRGIGHQGLWFDEAYTVMLVKLPLAKMLSTVPKTESTPYLYYLLAWGWTHVLGRGAGELRALSALFGIAVIPVAYMAASRLLGDRRAAVIVAALAAFNPLLIWYSQEARAYELLVLASACTLLAFARARERPTGGRLAAWALCAGLALATHYDAALVVIPEAVWLLIDHRRTLGAWLAAAFAAACGGGLLPLLIAQSDTHNSGWITRAPLNERLAQVLPQFLLGTGSHAYVALMWAGLLLGAAALALLVVAAETRLRVRAGLLAALTVGGFALIMIVVAAGSDMLLTRNLLALWLPACMVLAAGLGARRARYLGAGICAALCAIGLTATVSVATDRVLQRPDWSAVARALGPWPAAGVPRESSRLLVFPRNVWLESLTEVYLVRTRQLRRRQAHGVSEIDIVANTSPRGSNKHWLCWWGAGCNLYPAAPQVHYAIPGFHEAGRTAVRQFTIVRLMAERPRRVTRAQLHEAITAAGFFGLLLQRP